MSYPVVKAEQGATSYVRVGIVLSLLVHLLLVSVLRPSQIPPPLPQIIDVSIVQEQPTNQNQPKSRQMVSESQAPEAKEAPPDAYLAERTAKVDGPQQIRRGDPGAGVPGQVAPRSPPAQAQKETSTKPATQQPATSNPERSDTSAARTQHELKTLALSEDHLLAKFGAEKPQDSQREQQEANARPFSRPEGSGAQFLGLNGSLDHLPNLPDGDLTMLNTKANKFAVFVRRVALAVFSELRSNGWEHLSASDINSLTQDTEVRAQLSLDGRLLGVQISNSSGSSRFDSVVGESVKAGAADPHPPKEAVAADGTIRFIFRARSWSRAVANRKNGAMREARWLLLGTGLE